MAAPAAKAKRNEFATLVNEWESMYSRGFYETAQATLEPLGGCQSNDPRIAFLAACTAIRRLQYGPARDALIHAREAIRSYPQFLQILPNTAFARLPNAIDLLLATIEEGLMPDLRVSPVEFLRDPKRASLQLVGSTGGEVGRYMAPRPTYQARSLAAAQQSMQAPPRVPAIPTLREPIVIRDDSIVIRDETIVIRDDSIVIRSDQPDTAEGRTAAQASAVALAHDRQRAHQLRQDIAGVLTDKARALEAIQNYLRSGETASALKMAQQAVGRFSQSASVRESLARVQETLGLRDKAARTYLAAAHLAADGRSRQGTLERCLQQAVLLAGDNLIVLREVLAAAQRFDIKPVMRTALERLLSLEPSISDPIQCQTWARQLERLDPANPLIRSTRESVDRFERVAPAAGTDESIREANARLEVLEDRDELGGMAPIAGVEIASSKSSPAPHVNAPLRELPPLEHQPSISATIPGSPATPPPFPAPPPRPAPAPPASQTPGQTRPVAPPRPGTGAPPVPQARPGQPSAPPPVAPSPTGRALPQPSVRPAPPPSWTAPAPPAPADTRTRPPSSPPIIGPQATYPCFYCGQPVPWTEATCPACNHQQPAFLQRKAREARMAPSAGQTAPGQRRPDGFREPMSPLTRGAKDTQRADNMKAMTVVAAFMAFFGFIVGSSVICVGAFLLATQLEKMQKSEGKPPAPGVKLLKIASVIGIAQGLFRGSPF